jgi:hypothetical protein
VADGVFHGPPLARAALARSENVPAVAVTYIFERNGDLKFPFQIAVRTGTSKGVFTTTT